MKSTIIAVLFLAAGATADYSAAKILTLADAPSTMTMERRLIHGTPAAM
ncbi:hypothetical protein Vi05172_g301 [Venturia inaequalis]|nr:hypothetical protein Vi05172_g301 [Venturia inaequalis]